MNGRLCALWSGINLEHQTVIDGIIVQELTRLILSRIQSIRCPGELVCYEEKYYFQSCLPLCRRYDCLVLSFESVVDCFHARLLAVATTTASASISAWLASDSTTTITEIRRALQSYQVSISYALLVMNSS